MGGDFKFLVRWLKLLIVRQFFNYQHFKICLLGCAVAPQNACSRSQAKGAIITTIELIPSGWGVSQIQILPKSESSLESR